MISFFSLLKDKSTNSVPIATFGLNVPWGVITWAVGVATISAIDAEESMAIVFADKDYSVEIVLLLDSPKYPYHSFNLCLLQQHR